MYREEVDMAFLYPANAFQIVFKSRLTALGPHDSFRVKITNRGAP